MCGLKQKNSQLKSVWWTCLKEKRWHQVCLCTNCVAWWRRERIQSQWRCIYDLTYVACQGRCIQVLTCVAWWRRERIQSQWSCIHILTCVACQKRGSAQSQQKTHDFDDEDDQSWEGRQFFGPRWWGYCTQWSDCGTVQYTWSLFLS